MKNPRGGKKRRGDKSEKKRNLKKRKKQRRDSSSESSKSSSGSGSGGDDKGSSSNVQNAQRLLSAASVLQSYASQKGPFPGFPPMWAMGKKGLGMKGPSFPPGFRGLLMGPKGDIPPGTGGALSVMGGRVYGPGMGGPAAMYLPGSVDKGPQKVLNPLVVLSEQFAKREKNMFREFLLKLRKFYRRKQYAWERWMKDKAVLNI